MATKRLFLWLTGVGLWLFSALLQAGCVIPGLADAEPTPALRALSLANLQRELQACATGGSCQAQARSLGGITVPAGFMVDAGKDIVLLGWQEERYPAIRTDDLIVGLRAIWERMVQLGANYTLDNGPGCDISPRGDTLHRLQRIEDQFFRAESTVAQSLVLDAFSRECRAPQTVSVFGVPADSRWASVMVQADYDMKSLADGSAPSRVPGLLGVSEMMMKRSILESGGGAQAAQTRMNRFWLNTHGISALETEDQYLLMDAGVRVDTRPMGLTSSGGLRDIQGEDPDAQRFASSFTRMYPKVARQSPVYGELENLTRLTAISMALRARMAAKAIPMDMSYLLEGHKIESFPVAREVMGRDMVTEYLRATVQAGSLGMSVIRLPSCGGVSLNMRTPVKRPERESTQFERQLGQAVKESRPRVDTLAWTVAAPGRLLTSYRKQQNFHTLSRLSPRQRFIDVSDAGDRIAIDIQAQAPRTEGPLTLEEEVARVASYIAAAGDEVVVLRFDRRMEPAKVSALLGSIKFALRTLSPGVRFGAVDLLPDLSTPMLEPGTVLQGVALTPLDGPQDRQQLTVELQLVPGQQAKFVAQGTLDQMSALRKTMTEAHYPFGITDKNLVELLTKDECRGSWTADIEKPRDDSRLASAPLQ